MRPPPQFAMSMLRRFASEGAVAWAQSLPMEAVCYYGTDGVCVVFSIKYGAGQLLFIGFDYTTLSQPWIKTLIAGMEFAS